MNDTLHILNSSGDQTISWDPTSEQERSEVQTLVDTLRAQGYEFFLVDGSPAPAVVTEGQGSLSCRRIPPEEVVRTTVAASPPPPAPEGTPIEALALTPRAQRALRDAKIQTIERLIEWTAEQVLALEGIGIGALNRIRERLAARHLALATTATVPESSARRTIATRRMEGG